jgi:uncharacterized protein
MLYTGFILGIIGSIHCVGMCAPLTLMLPNIQNHSYKFYLGRLLYNLGRILTYGFLGLIIGSIGEAIGLFISQKSLSIVFGLMILIVLLLPKSLSLKLDPYLQLSKLINRIKNNLKATSNSSFYLRNFSFGIFNGLIPCGLLYGTLSTAFLMETKTNSSMYMLLFGLGTLPLMFFASLGFGFMGKIFQSKIKKLIPITYGIIAVMLILRGLNFPIKSIYAAPDPNATVCHPSVNSQTLP